VAALALRRAQEMQLGVRFAFSEKLLEEAVLPVCAGSPAKTGTASRINVVATSTNNVREMDRKTMEASKCSAQIAA